MILLEIQDVGAVYAAIIAAAITVVVSIITLWIEIVRRREERRQESFFKALGFLDGGSQKRNLGIAAIELSLKKSWNSEVCISLLMGQAIYLLRESKQGNSEHEIYNLERIMSIIHAFKEDAVKDANYSLFIAAIEKTANNKKTAVINSIEPIKESLKEIKANIDDVVKEVERHGNEKGLAIPSGKLISWLKDFRNE